MIDRCLSVFKTAIYDSIVVLIKIGHWIEHEQIRRRDRKLMANVEGENR
jgi:hypothetical protein